MRLKKSKLELDIEQKESEKGNLAQAIKISSEFCSAVLVGGVLGLAIDKYFSTTPWGLVFLLILGSIAGFVNVIRSISSKKN